MNAVNKSAKTDHFVGPPPAILEILKHKVPWRHFRERNAMMLITEAFYRRFVGLGGGIPRRRRPRAVKLAHEAGDAGSAVAAGWGVRCHYASAGFEAAAEMGSTGDRVLQTRCQHDHRDAIRHYVAAGWLRLGIALSSLTINPALRGGELPYDTLKDLTGISLVMTGDFGVFRASDTADQHESGT